MIFPNPCRYTTFPAGEIGVLDSAALKLTPSETNKHTLKLKNTLKLQKNVGGPNFLVRVTPNVR